jgi:hypothetical protein
MLSEIETEELFAELDRRAQQRAAGASIVASAEVLHDYAMKPVLHKAEAVAILQGFRPPLGAVGNEKIFYLDDEAGAIERFLVDSRGGRLPSPCTPRELVAWADALSFSLPAAFKSAVPTVAPKPDELSRPEGNAASDKELNADVQAVMDRHARVFFEKNKRHAKKSELVRAVAREVGLSASRVERVTRRTWVPMPRHVQHERNRLAEKLRRK